LLGEPFGPATAFGGVLVLAGVYASQRSSQPRTASGPAERATG
jgi:drug/metabolite transporter (DMT)-like permease